MLKWIIGLLLATIALLALLQLLMTAPVGDPIPSYKTEKQQFSWGEMYAWVSVRERNVSGTLLINFSFASSVMDKKCVLSVNRMLLNDPVTGIDLIDRDYILPGATTDRTQMSLASLRFNQFNFPYDLKIDLDFDCDGAHESFTFSKPLEFRMVQPRWAGQ